MKNSVYNMSEAANREKTLYMREWRSKNRDKCRAAQTRYWEKKAQAHGKQDGEKNDD